MDDTTRRFQGEFFTPTEWVDEAHRMIENEFGEDWKDKYVVYDPACGHGNLTRDYKFKELYCSTLNQSDLDVMNQMGYNPEATKFQFDFLNDDIFPDGILPINEVKFKMPESLKNTLKEKKQIIIFMNPPFAEDGNYKKDGLSKSGVSKTTVASLYKMGKSFKQLYIQFLFRCILLKKQFKNVNISIVTFSTVTYLIGSNSNIFREEFFKHFCFKQGMVFEASEFNNVSKWPLIFSIFTQDNCLNKTSFQFQIKKNDLGNIKNLETIDFYNTDSLKNLKSWVKSIKNVEDRKTPCVLVNNALSVIKEKVNKPINSLGYFSYRNNVGSASKHVGLFSAKYNDNGTFIWPENFDRCMITFASSRLLCKCSNWLIDYKELLEPTNIPRIFYNDSVVYSLFENQCKTSSFIYKNLKIKNEWFWISQEHIQLLAEKHKINEIEQDIKDFGGDRFVYNKLQETILSKDAKNVLNKAIELVKDSFEYRKLMIEEYPEYHLNCWDSGWYQIKKILNKYMKDELKEFSILYKEFEDRMEKGVYKFEFLRK